MLHKQGAINDPVEFTAVRPNKYVLGASKDLTDEQQLVYGVKLSVFIVPSQYKYPLQHTTTQLTNTGQVYRWGGSKPASTQSSSNARSGSRKMGRAKVECGSSERTPSHTHTTQSAPLRVRPVRAERGLGLPKFSRCKPSSSKMA